MVLPLTVDDLYQRCDLSRFSFDTTADLEPLTKPLGQDRALEAINFGIDINQQGFHIFALGPPGVGKNELVKAILADQNSRECQLFDWCYVNNFNDPQKPQLLKLDSGMGTQFSKDMLQLIEDILTSLPSAFQTEEYHSQLREIEDTMNQRYEQAFSKLTEEAKEKNIALMRTPRGFSLGPVDENGIISPEDFDKLPEEQREQTKQTIAELQLELQKVVSQLPLLKREASHDIQTLNKGITRLTVEQFVGWLENKYQHYVEVINYLTAVKDFAIDNAEVFLPEGDNPNVENIKQKARSFTPFRVNVIVDNTDTSSLPIVFEDNPTYQNLVGRVEYISEMGNLLTDLTLIKSGSLHRANGGYLIIDARKLLSHVYAWEGLKRALTSCEVKIESLQEVLSLGSMSSLEPESIPINVKIVLLGEPLLYYRLNEYDPEFSQLFNVAAEFCGKADRNADTLLSYAQLLATIQQRSALRALNTVAVGRVIEHASRLVDDSEKLSLKLEGLRELLQEADYWSRKDDKQVIGIEEIEKTIYSQHRRQDLIKERFQEQITRDIKLIDTTGSKVAQVNGLSVLQLGDFAFGTPTRITATARLGMGKLMDIERESKLGGHIHTKGVMIIGAYLANKYAAEQPFPLAASLVFEQSYGGVDGDSASCAEVCVLLSAIGKIGLRQDLAVTGSMNQLGEIQAIGGVNHKIEGFFDICKARGLSGQQGVIIPASNQVNLMLNADVRDAVERGQFHIYSADHIEQVMEKLSGLAAGKPDSDGVYSDDSFNRTICDRIAVLQQIQKKFSPSTDSEKIDSEQIDSEHSNEQ